MGKMKAYMMDLEDKFIDEVSTRIGGCEVVHDLLESLENDGCMDLIAHMTDSEKCGFVEDLWNEFWSEYAYDV